MTEAELKELVIPTDTIVLHKEVVLGRGGYGYVCYGVLEHEDGHLEKVAVKMMITEGNVPENIKKSLVKEACKLREVSQHEHIVKLLGVIMEQDNYGLVLELMVFENCLAFINEYAVIWPQNQLLIQICQQVTSAMTYLHTSTPPMLHMDLKGDNVLINHNFDAKICDFGISEWKTRTTRLDRQGTITHIAPEILNNLNIQSKPEQDVYSFGISLWEIFTGLKPYIGKSDDVVKTCVKDGQRPDMAGIGERCPDYMVAIMKRCWHQDPNARPTFDALQQELGHKCRKLRLQIFEGKKAVRRKICDKHAFNELKRLQTVHWDSIEEPSDDPDISVDAVPISPQVTRELSTVSADGTSKINVSDETTPPLVGKRYKFSLPKKEITFFDMKVREILRDPLLMEMVTSGCADNLRLTRDVIELFSNPKLLQKYIDEDTDFKLELERSRHSVFDNVHCPKIKAAQQKGVASQREIKENDVFRYTKYYPTKSESEKTDREKRQEARLRSMHNCSYVGKLYKSGLYEKVVKALKEPHQIRDALTDLETGSGEAEKFSIISRDVLKAVQDPVLMQILLSQNPESLDQFMRYYPELTMKLLASNKTQYGTRQSSYHKRSSREQDHPRSRLDRDPFDSDSDEEMRTMLTESGVGHLPLLPNMMGSGHMGRRLRDMFLPGAMRRKPEAEARRQHMAIKKDKKMEQTNRKEPYPPSRTPHGTNSERSYNNPDASDEKSEKPKVKVTPMEVNEPKPPRETVRPKKKPISLEASMDEMSVESVYQISIEDTADGVILYSEVDRDSSVGKIGVTQAVTTLKNLSRSRVPNLQLRLVDELPVGGKSEFDYIEYILSHFNYIFIYLTPNFNPDTLKRFQSQMCLLETILNKSWRVIPLVTEKDIPNAPLELKVLRPLQMFHLKNPDVRIREMFLDSFSKTILVGREKGYAAKSPNAMEDKNKSNTNLPKKQANQSEVNPTGLSNQKGNAGPSQGQRPREVTPTPASNVTTEEDAEPGSNEEPDLKKKSSNSSEKQGFDSSEQNATPGIHTITHRHAGGGTTKINLVPGANIPNFQVGNKNIMVIGAGGDVQDKSKSKSKKSKENVKLTESEEPVSRDEIDIVSTEIGKDWRRLCRSFGFSDGETEQFYQDFNVSGTYEIMYQAMRRWIQKSPREATVKTLAEILHTIDRDDLATQLK